ncbi:amino acid ABC transporter permease [Paracandidimonas soli]|uniref:amino acid ABC transporter permease n=1 Tax=Paracandidimonas soli TaxID=1917182 RepID=UPI00334224AC
MSTGAKTRSSRRGRPDTPFSWRGLWRSQRMRGYFYQVLVVAGMAAIILFMVGNALQSMAAKGMRIGLGFLSNEAGFTLAESVLPFGPTNTFLQAFVAGLGNTLWVSFVSLIFATLLGVLVGMARLSSNWLVSRGAAVYVEIFRNTPQLIQIVFWYTLFTLLPGARQAWHGMDWWFLSNRGLVLAWPEDRHAFTIVALALAAGLGGVYFFAKWADQRQRSTGQRLPVLVLSMAGLIAVGLLAWLATGAPTAIEYPRLTGFNFRGGITLSPEFLALALGLVLYFAAYISEIVRSGIQSVGKGQIEAGRAVGLHGFELYRHIILPQALRVIVPPVTAQYISLIKTSALGVAVGYPELFNVSNSIMTLSGHTLECVIIMGLVYLLLALGVSSLMNVFNRAVALRGAAR